MKTMSCRFQRCGELRILREESVAGVNRLGAGSAGRSHHGVDVEVALARRGRSDVDRDVGLGDVARACVGVAEHGNRPDTHCAQRANHPHGDLATVGDQNRIEALHERRPFLSIAASTAASEGAEEGPKRDRSRHHIRNTP